MKLWALIRRVLGGAGPHAFAAGRREQSGGPGAAWRGLCDRAEADFHGVPEWLEVSFVRIDFGAWCSSSAVALSTDATSTQPSTSSPRW